MKLRRGSMSNGGMVVGLVLTLIVAGVVITIGSIIFQKNWTVLDGLRDSDFSESANDTISGVASDFWSSMDITRMLLLVLAGSAVLGGLLYYLAGRFG